MHFCLRTYFPVIVKILFSAISVVLVSSCERKLSDDKDDPEPGSDTIELFADGLRKPIGIASAGDSRLFIVEQDGTIAIIDTNGIINPVKFLDITERVVSGGEQGLLGLAFHPDFKSNGWFYVNYIGSGDSTHISRVSVSKDDPDRADPFSELKLLSFSQPFKNHNGGDIKFGPDGYLYIASGDGGSSGDPGNRAQNPEVLYGKILRVDVSACENNDSGALPEIWAYGLRNPWRMSFDRLTGDLWIADVGQNNIEEINMQPAGSAGGENYGWRCYEGSEEFNTDSCNDPGPYIFPVYEYQHGTTECSVTGGFVFRGKEDSEYYGRYFFADFCSGKIWTLQNSNGEWTTELFGIFPGNGFSTFGEDTEGNLYIAGLDSGVIYRFRL